MAHSKSAIKAARQTVKHARVNRHNLTRLRTSIKNLRESILAKDKVKAASLLRAAVAMIDRSIGKGVIHRNAAARYKSRLTTQVRKLTA